MSQDEFEPHSYLFISAGAEISWLQGLGSRARLEQMASLILNLWQTAASAHQIEMHSTDSQARGHCLIDELVDKTLKILAQISINLDTNQSVL